MPMKIVILEDNEERRDAMQACLADRFDQYELRFFEEPAVMTEYLRGNLPETILVSLDHDLDLRPGKTDGKWRDPGTGRDVADFLALQEPTCPVVIHTSNCAAAVGMEQVLREAGWRTHGVAPCDDLEWIPTVWFRTVRHAIVASAQPKRVGKRAM